MRRITRFIAIGVLLAASAPAAGQAASVSCLASKCHREITQKRYVHGPIGSGSCEVCHQVSSWPEGKHPSILTHSAAEKCYFCHQETQRFVSDKHRHTPVAKGECTACHDAHQSENRFFLKANGHGWVARQADLCLTCHGSKNELSGFHAAVELLDCNICHDPHSSPERYQLTVYVKTVYIRDYLALGQEELAAGNNREAADALRQVLVVEPREVSALIMSAQAFLAMDDPQSAQSMVDRLMEINPLSPETLHLKGQVAARQGNDFQALSFLQQSLVAKPEVPAVLLDLGLLQLKRGMHQEALATLLKASEKKAGDPAVHSALARAYDALGRSQDAGRERDLERQLRSSGSR